MSFLELVSTISKRTGMPQKTVRSILKAFVTETKIVVKQGERVVLPGFGVFVYHKGSSRPLFGSGVDVDVRPSIRFRQSRRSR